MFATLTLLTMFTLSMTVMALEPSCYMEDAVTLG